MTRGRREPDRIVQLEIVLDQKRLSRRDHRLAVEPPHIARRVLAAPGRVFPGRILTFVKHVFGLREGGYPTSIAQQRVPPAVVDVQVSAKDVIDVLKPEGGRAETIEPWLLGKIERGRIPLVLAR